jgi:hypothetical protein
LIYVIVGRLVFLVEMEQIFLLGRVFCQGVYNGIAVLVDLTQAAI